MHRTASDRSPSTPSVLDAILAAQCLVAWAGEKGEDPRLGWWRTDLVTEFGGLDLFERLVPHTWRWAVLQAVREAARRHDAALRAKDHDPDRVISIFNLGFDLNERVEERLHDLRRAGAPPEDVLPGLAEVMIEPWDRGIFEDWVKTHGATKHKAAPMGRHLTGALPSPPEQLIAKLVGALAPLGDTYPLPHFRRPA